MFGRWFGRGLGTPSASSLRAALGAVSALALMTAVAARAETIGGALTKAYLNNPNINQERAAVRAADEGIPKAQAAGLPTVTAETDDGLTSTLSQNIGAGSPPSLWSATNPRGFGVTVSQTIYNGNRTSNGVAQAESTVLGTREQLRYTEQTVLLQALTAYMDVLKNAAIVDLNKNNVQVLVEQLRQTTDRFNVGELTRTDVAQAEATLAGAQAQELEAESTLAATLATYRQVIGDEPHNLAPVAPLGKQLPRTVSESIRIAVAENPAVVAMLHGVDVAELAIKIAEGSLLPSVSLQGQLADRWDYAGYATGNHVWDGTVVAQLSMPIYDGGATYAGIRQAKEQLAQQELNADYQRDQVRQAVVAAWGANENSTGVLKAAKAQVQAAEVALEGVREEAKVGQRTTLDVLNAELAVLNARVQLVTAQHDQVVNSYTLLSAIGRLGVKNLGLSVVEYDPRVHFNQVRNKVFGEGTPDGR